MTSDLLCLQVAQLLSRSRRYNDSFPWRSKSFTLDFLLYRYVSDDISPLILRDHRVAEFANVLELQQFSFLDCWAKMHLGPVFQWNRIMACHFAICEESVPSTFPFIRSLCTFWTYLPGLVNALPITHTSVGLPPLSNCLRQTIERGCRSVS